MADTAKTFRAHLLPLVILILGVALVYAPSLHHEFLTNWDDRLYVTDNPSIRGLTWENLKSAFTSFYVGNYAPLHIVSYMVDYELWGLNPAGYIFGNIALHTANGILFYLILAGRGVGKPAAFCAAFIFLLHPVQVESVDWISQRKNLLAMFFFLGAFRLYVASRPAAGGSKPALYIVSIAAFAAAILAKSVAVIFPFVLILDDLCSARRNGWRSLADKVPFLAAAAIIGTVSLVSQDGTYSGGRVGYYGGSFGVELLTMLPVLPQYLIMLLFPARLSIIYGFPVRQEIDLQVVLAALLLILLFALGVTLYRRRRHLFFWFALFFIGLLPVSNIVPLTTFMNDRYLYFPMLGFASFAALLLAAVPADDQRRGRFPWRWALACLILLPLPFLSLKRGEVWQDSITLWTDGEAKSEEGIGYGFSVKFASLALAEAYRHEGSAAYERGDITRARTSFLQALAHDPDDHNSLSLLGMIFLRENRPLQARPYLLRLTNRFKRSGVGYRNLGFSYLMTGEWGAATAAFRHVLELEPDNVQVQEYLATALRKTGRGTPRHD